MTYDLINVCDVVMCFLWFEHSHLSDLVTKILLNILNICIHASDQVWFRVHTPRTEICTEAEKSQWLKDRGKNFDQQQQKPTGK